MITNPVSVNASAPSSNSQGSSGLAAGGAGEERNMFMNLLVAQLKNQDPLSPQDGAAFVAQLAQFNSLDQLVGIRDSIDQLTRLLQTQRNTTPTPGSSGSPESTPKV